MTPERHARIQQIFESAVDLCGDQRDSYLDQACAGDADLRQRVGRLLAADDQKTSLQQSASTQSLELAVFQRGQKIADRYRIICFLGAGGMGQVYQARDEVLDRFVALKTIRPEIASHSETFERFKREVKLAHEVADEHVRRVFDLDHRNQPPFLTMEFIEGQTLAARLSRADATKLSKAEALAVIKQIARGLQALHQKGIVHGDLKPGNIMLTLAGGAIQVKICQDYGFRPGAQPASRQYRRFRAHHGHAVLHGPGAVGGGKGTIASDRHIQPAGLPDNSAIAALLGSLGPGKQEETRADAFAAGQIAGSTKRKWDPAMSAYHVSMALSHISWNLQANRMMNNFGATSLNLPSAFNEKCLSHPNLELRFLAINYLVQPGKPALDLLNAFLYARDHPGGTLYQSDPSAHYSLFDQPK